MMSSAKYESMLSEYAATKILFGTGVTEQLVTILQKQQVRKPLIFAGGSSHSKNPAVPTVSAQLEPVYPKVKIHRGIPAEPAVKDVLSMIESLKTYAPDQVIAIGGGSVMDAAKAAWIGYRTGIPVMDLFGSGKITAQFPNTEWQRIICIPTTSGTGSEVTPYSNIVDPEAGVKKLIVDPAIVPGCALVDPAFTLTMPEMLTVTTALDALVHCVESVLNYRASNAHPDAVAWGLEGIRQIARGLPDVLKRPDDLSGRTALSAAAVLGGMCIKNRPTSLPHLCSFSFYGQVPHGIAVAALLPPFWKYYLTEPQVCELTMQMAGIFADTPEKTPEDVVVHAAEFMIRCGGPKRLADLGCDRSIIAKTAAAAAMNPVKLQSCPRPVSIEEASPVIQKILTEAW